MTVPILRPYQAAPARAILKSAHEKRGDTITVMMARQAGKNELSAQLELMLLLAHAPGGGQLVKCAPTFRPQVLNSMRRLQERILDAGLRPLARREQGYIIYIGRARALFFSAAETANVVGATASLLLEVDEAQDVSAAKYSKDFRPMAATTNATTVMYGTAWDDRSLLEQAKQRNLELERKDGRRRHFEYDWQKVAELNPHYLAFVEAERARLGETHPLFQTQYCLRPLAGGGRLLSPSQRAQLEGDHPRRPRRAEGKVYIAGVDLAGEDEEAEDAALRSLQPRRDSTVVTIAEVEFSEVTTDDGGRTTEGVVCGTWDVGARPHPDLLPEGEGSPPSVVRRPSSVVRLRIVDHFYRTGVRHAALYPQLLDLLDNVWGCRRIAVDATGVGQPVASFLADALGSRVVPVTFTAAAKSELAYAFLAAVNAGRLKMYAPDGSAEHAQFWREMELARYALRANQAMNFFVDPAEGHDDFLMSAALAVHAAAGYRPRSARGRVS